MAMSTRLSSITPADLADFLERATYVPPKRPRKPRRKAPEQAFQQTAAQYLRWALCSPSLALAIPGGGLSHMQAKIWKSMGYRAGSPDMMVLHLGRCYFLECKAVKGGKIIDSQKELHPQLIAVGCPVAIVRTIDEIRNALSSWGIPLREHREGGSRARNATVEALIL